MAPRGTDFDKGALQGTEIRLEPAPGRKPQVTLECAQKHDILT